MTEPATGEPQSTPPTKGLVARCMLGLIRFYRRGISPLLPPLCRFEPTCSCYAAEAIQTHGALKGFSLALRRLLRCHPFSRGGYDPVPDSSGNS